MSISAKQFANVTSVQLSRSVVLSNLPHASTTRRMHDNHEPIVKYPTKTLCLRIFSNCNHGFF